MYFVVIDWSYKSTISCSPVLIQISAHLNLPFSLVRLFRKAVTLCTGFYYKFVTEKSLTLVNYRIHHCLYTYTCSALKSPFNNHMTSLFSGKQIKQFMSWSWEVGRQNEFNNQLLIVGWTSFKDEYNINTLASKTDHWQYFR